MNDLAPFDEFFRREFVPLIAFVRKLGSPPAVAEDAAADAMTTLYRRWESVDAPAAWVRTTAARLAAKIQMREREAVARYVQSIHQPVRNAPSAEDMANEWDSVVQMLGRLPSRQREVMAWYLDGFKPTDIAELLGMNESTVRSHLRHAREQLKAQLTNDMGWDHG